MGVHQPELDGDRVGLATRDWSGYTVGTPATGLFLYNPVEEGSANRRSRQLTVVHKGYRVEVQWGSPWSVLPTEDWGCKSRFTEADRGYIRSTGRR